jgi:Family of unknown function (DUF6168)
MSLKNYKPILGILAVSTLLYLLHKILFFVLEKKAGIAPFHYTLETVYLFFATLSIIIVAILLIVKQKSFDNVGMVFLLITSLKMIICYLFIKPILHPANTNNYAEKINFFVLFILFLAIETVVTIRILNNKQ